MNENLDGATAWTFVNATRTEYILALSFTMPPIKNGIFYNKWSMKRFLGH